MIMRASKRGATSDLNHDNWNQEEESEDPGTYEQASCDVVSRRKIRVARRRGVGSEEPSTGGLFKSFTGFGPTGLGGAAVPNFNFGGGNSEKTSGGEPAAKRSLTNDKSECPPAEVFQFGRVSSNSAKSFSFGTAAEPMKTKTMTSNDATKENVSTRDRHLHMLRSLNLSVNKWISSHVEKDPYCDLSPVFADYEKHLREIEKQYPYDAGDVSVAPVEAKRKEEQPPQKNADVNCSNSHTAAEHALPTGKNSAGAKTDFSCLFGRGVAPTLEKALSKPPTVAANFGLSSAQLTSVSEDKEDSAEEEEEEEEKEKEPAKKPVETKATGFSFGATKPFSFGLDALQKTKPADDEGEKPAPTLFGGMSFSLAGKTSTSVPSVTSAPFSFGLSSGTGPSSFVATAAKEEEETYEPPKVEVKEIKEDGAVITKRCKLFYKSEDAWQDKGVGNLHLKPIDAGKLQAIIRADTNLGTILLNVMLTNVIPVTRQKNNLTLLCVPSPPMKPVKGGEEAPKVPIPLLVRFKTETDCEEVLQEIERLREGKK